MYEEHIHYQDMVHCKTASQLASCGHLGKRLESINVEWSRGSSRFVCFLRGASPCVFELWMGAMDDDSLDIFWLQRERALVEVGKICRA